uniref:Uncharacterized protein n=1 Tax=Phlebotomus papatasi TaxID=29031 RepID=A0A1B0EYT1_PHLPP
MEFPELGKQCQVADCQRLDFLPVKCDACNKIHCSDHYSYERHSCTSVRKKNVQVPVCPLCNEPVPTPSDVSPDLTVGRHIDQFCRSDRKPVFTNRCSFPGCRQKELVPILVNKWPITTVNTCPWYLSYSGPLHTPQGVVVVVPAPAWKGLRHELEPHPPSYCLECVEHELDRV